MSRFTRLACIGTRKPLSTNDQFDPFSWECAARASVPVKRLSTTERVFRFLRSPLDVPVSEPTASPDTAGTYADFPPLIAWELECKARIGQPVEAHATEDGRCQPRPGGKIPSLAMCGVPIFLSLSLVSLPLVCGVPNALLSGWVFPFFILLSLSF